MESVVTDERTTADLARVISSALDGGEQELPWASDAEALAAISALQDRVERAERDWNRGAELDQVRLAQIERLEAALREIRDTAPVGGLAYDIARAALTEEGE